MPQTDAQLIDGLPLAEWLQQRELHLIRTHATSLDGPAVGKYLQASSFEKAIPAGHGLSYVALTADLTGTPHLNFWHSFQASSLGDILLRPDLSTLAMDGKDPHLGHCIGDFTMTDGKEISICPRTLLRKVTKKIATAGYRVKAAFELEFFLYNTSFSEARQSGYQDLKPIGATTLHNIYLLKNAYHAKPFMEQLAQQLERQGIAWEAWNDEGGAGQVELNFPPTEPVRAADVVSRAKQIIYELAVDMNLAVTFMAQPSSDIANGLHIHHSLVTPSGEAAFYDTAQSGRSALMLHWIAGILASMPGAASYLCPSINSWRRLKEFTAAPVSVSWGEENKTAALRVVSRAPGLARIEHRLVAGDANPYLALAVILAGGLAGLTHKLTPPKELPPFGGEPPAGEARLPRSITQAAKALREDVYLAEILGADVVDYWLKTRRAEWLSFHNRRHAPAVPGPVHHKKHQPEAPTLWELERYFELM